jgi:hypothetical protein
MTVPAAAAVDAAIAAGSGGNLAPAFRTGRDHLRWAALAIEAFTAATVTVERAGRAGRLPRVAVEVLVRRSRRGALRPSLLAVPTVEAAIRRAAPFARARAPLAAARRRTRMLRLGLRRGLRMGLRLGLAAIAVVAVVVLLGHRRPARAGEQEDGKRGGEFRLHGLPPRASGAQRLRPSCPNYCRPR